MVPFCLVPSSWSIEHDGVLFLLPDAEELGGVGSMHLIDNPPFPLPGISANINLDELGREDSSPPKLKDFVYFYLSRMGREELRSIRDKAAVVFTELFLEHRESYSGSDHIFFERTGIPVIVLSTGQPRDHHQPMDAADKLDYKNVRDIARLAFASAWQIANSSEKIGRNNHLK
jgi:Zn-dependent M28 family amino/carboxypeptidase